MFNSKTSHCRSAVRRCPLRVLAASLVAAAGLLGMTYPEPATADMGPCRMSAPTTSEVFLFASDVDRSARWYRDNAGLVEERRWVDPSFGGATLIRMRRDEAGVTLISSPQPNNGFHDPQMVCLVVNGPPAPPAGSNPIYLVDPDGTSVELPPAANSGL